MSKPFVPPFIIKNDSACVYKWGWNTFRLHNATSSSCHRVTPVPVALDNFENFHNTPEVIQDRKLMLAGQWPVGRGCEYCQEMEVAGGMSDRTYHNAISGLTPVDFDPLGDQHVTPTVAEIYLTNTCDLACIYCIPEFSSRINNELKKYGPNIVGHRPSIPIHNSSAYLDRYFDWLETNYSKLVRLSVLGGEPLIQRDLDRFLDFLNTHKNPELEFAINTNLNCRLETIQQFVETAQQLIASKKIKRVDISCSLDCWGDPATYIRNGLSLDRWQENFEYLIQNKWLYVTVHQVLTSLSIGTADILQDKISQYKQSTKWNITQAYHAVDDHDGIWRPEIFGSEFFKPQLDQLLAKFLIKSKGDEIARLRLEGIVKLTENKQPNLVKLSKFSAALDQLDRRRGTDWRLIFPEINEFLFMNGIK